MAGRPGLNRHDAHAMGNDIMELASDPRPLLGDGGTSGVLLILAELLGLPLELCDPQKALSIQPAERREQNAGNPECGIKAIEFSLQDCGGRQAQHHDDGRPAAERSRVRSEREGSKQEGQERNERTLALSVVLVGRWGDVTGDQYGQGQERRPPSPGQWDGRDSTSDNSTKA